VLVLLSSYLVLVFLLPVTLSAVVSYRALPQGRTCPYCRAETLRLVAPRLQLLDRINPLASLQRRWCMECGWEGVARVGESAGAGPRAVEPVHEPRPALAPTQTLTVRALDVDGAPWRVMLQCWNTTGLYYGRFVFVAPSGRLWLGAVEPFSGESEREVLVQARSLPDGQLERRLRQLVSRR
jgi:hypothetical protein